MNRRRSSGAVLTSLAFVTLAGCSSDAESVEGDGARLSVERVTLATSNTSLRAGDPYMPLLDRRPLAVTGDECLKGAHVVVHPGTTSVDATVVSSRKDLLAKLDVSATGSRGELTGSARVAGETKLATGTVTLLFQAKGVFETELAGLDEEPPPFDVGRVARCGWGYVRNAHHRLAAVVVVTIRATDESSSAVLGCPPDQTCAPTSIKAGSVEARVSLEAMLRKGSFELSLQSVADTIPDLPPAPFSGMAALSSTPETAAAVLDKLSTALEWLGTAQTAIAARIEAYASGTSIPASPTTKVDFSFYPGLSRAARTSVGETFDGIVALRAEYADVAERLDRWERFQLAEAAGSGHLFNVLGSPVSTTAELVRRATEVVGPGGLLPARRDAIDERLLDCADAVANESGHGERATSDTALFARVSRACAPLPATSWERDYARKYDVRALIPQSVTSAWPADMECPEGQRPPTRDEVKLLTPWSHVTAERGAGIWIDSGLLASYWLKAGVVETLYRKQEGVRVCFADLGGVLEP